MQMTLISVVVVHKNISRDLQMILLRVQDHLLSELKCMAITPQIISEIDQQAKSLNLV